MPIHARKKIALSLAFATASLCAVGVASPTDVRALEAHPTPLPPGHAAAQSVAEAPATATATFPYENTFKLHSYPGAQRVIYIDFDGETITNTAWNKNYGATINAAAFDVDGNAGSFSTRELDIVQSVWQRVAEDFAPLAVDVTTEDPGFDAIDRTTESDSNYGTRALVTSTSTISSTCGCSGVAYVGAFNIWGAHATYQPAFVFSKALGPSDKDLADTVAHEVGHNLGLNHDGQGSDDYYFGQGAWAPTMGAGFYRPLTQFSKGDYAGANNTEDDFAVMARHGALLRSDDHVDTPVGASLLDRNSSARGVISSDADVDVFSFSSAGGLAAFSATPLAKGPNLDVQLDVLDAEGAVVATADPPSAMPSSSDYDAITGLDASVSVQLGVGTYFLRVQGVGAGSPATTGYSGYGSLGQYTITSTAAAAPGLSVSDVSVDEGNAGTTSVNFTLSLSAPSANPVSVSVATANGNGRAGSDYTATSGVVTVPAGQTSATFTVDAAGDTTPEVNEKFSIKLSNPTGATITDEIGIATLVNDDGNGVKISDVAKLEGAAGTITTFTFTVSLAVAAVVETGVTVSTANGSAIAGGTDYYAKSLLLTFLPGQRFKTVSISVKGDRLRESDEVFYMQLTNPTGVGLQILDAQGVGTIKNDD